MPMLPYPMPTGAVVPVPQQLLDMQAGTVLNDTTPSEKISVITPLLYITPANLSTNRNVELISKIAPAYVDFAAT